MENVTRTREDLFSSRFTLNVIRAASVPCALTLLFMAAGAVFARDTITSPVSAPGRIVVGQIQLDANGFPVVSYIDNENGDFRIIHCNDVNCAGGDESISAVGVGEPSSMSLDANGYPVVSYDTSNGDVKILHCNDVNCAGGDESNT